MAYESPSLAIFSALDFLRPQLIYSSFGGSWPSSRLILSCASLGSSMFGMFGSLLTAAIKSSGLLTPSFFILARKSSRPSLYLDKAPCTFFSFMACAMIFFVFTSKTLPNIFPIISFVPYLYFYCLSKFFFLVSNSSSVRMPSSRREANSLISDR